MKSEGVPKVYPAQGETCKSGMALFGDDEGDVPPFDMTEDGEDWFQFTLDNLEMDRGCSPLQQDANPMEQVRVVFPNMEFFTNVVRSSAKPSHRPSTREAMATLPTFWQPCPLFLPMHSFDTS